MGRKELPFGRSLVRLLVRLSKWKKKNDNVAEKSDDKGKKEQN
jgi:hypothetical protein